MGINHRKAGVYEEFKFSQINTNKMFVYSALIYERFFGTIETLASIYTQYKSSLYVYSTPI